MNETFNEAAPTLKFGTVSAVNEQTMRVRVRLPDLDNLRTDWLPVLTRKSLRDKDYWLPDVGEHVAVLLDANGDDGVVLGAIFSEADIVPVAGRNKRHVRFEDGTWIEYDREEHYLQVDCMGDIRVRAKGSVQIVIEGNADVKVDGNASVMIGGWAQIVAQGRMLIKSLTRLILKGPSKEIVL